jgi:hypothetical protein
MPRLRVSRPFVCDKTAGFFLGRKLPGNQGTTIQLPPEIADNQARIRPRWTTIFMDIPPTATGDELPENKPRKIRTWWHPLLASLLRWQLGSH